MTFVISKWPSYGYSNMTNFTKSLNCAASRLAHLRVSQNFACRIHTTNRCLKNYYRTLGLEYNATDHQIKQAYKKLAVKYSPNRNRTERGAAIFQEVTEAYKVLGNEKNRQEYDSRLSMRLKIFLANPIAAISRRVYINADENEERRKINDKEKIENEAVSKYFLVVGPFFAFLLILKYYGYWNAVNHQFCTLLSSCWGSRDICLRCSINTVKVQSTFG